MKKNDYFESIVRGLAEAVDDAESNTKPLKRTKRTILVVPIKKYSAKDVKRIRKNTRMTQRAFASYLGVSLKTVEAWESGKNIPSGSSSRILNMFEINKNLADDYPFVQLK